ncbi:MAG: glycosyltransferase [Candidatus Sumerlaeota bacterium]|nr:glycosyltransferase [Candidatus Sumerlaeota bacterium]
MTPDASAPWLSIIIPAFNEEKCIAGCIESAHSACRAVLAPDQAFEIIVVDNNSTDRTAQLAREAGVRVVFEPVNQIARARNRGAQEAQGQWLVFLDADSFLSEELLRDTVQAMNDARIIGGGTLARFPDSAVLTMRLGMRVWNGISRVFRWACGAYIFCRAEAFRSIGGFDTMLYATEELDLSARLKRLARKNRQRFVILTRHRLLTSDRKWRLYRVRQMLRLLLYVLWSPRRAPRDRKRCNLWYDGKR